MNRLLNNWKPAKGSLVLEREQEQAQALAVERREKGIAMRRDGRCRWPEKHTCRFVHEAAHIKDASLGGPMQSENLVRFCGWIHRRGPESIHGKQLKVECETARGAWGPLSFWRKTAPEEWTLIAREIRPFEYEHD